MTEQVVPLRPPCPECGKPGAGSVVFFDGTGCTGRKVLPCETCMAPILAKFYPPPRPTKGPAA